MKRFVAALCVAAAVSGCSWGSDDSGPHSSPSTQPPTVTSEPSFNLGDVLKDAVALGVDLRSSPVVLTLPDCFGGVNRVALVSNDLRSTSWEIVAADPAGPLPRVHELKLGEAPDGFRTVVPLADRTTTSGIVVANGPDHLGMVALDKADGAVTPRGCASATSLPR